MKASVQTSNPITENLATPLPGWVATFFVNYHGRRIGPYYSRNWKRNGKLHKQYIKPSDVEKVRARCQAFRDQRSRQREITLNFSVTFDNLNYMTRMIKRLKNGPLRDVDYSHIARLEQNG